MKVIAALILTTQLLVVSARAQVMTAVAETPYGEQRPWIYSLDFIYIEPDDPFHIRFDLTAGDVSVDGVGFDLVIYGPLDVLSVTGPGGIQNTGSRINLANGYKQEIRILGIQPCLASDSTLTIADIELQVTAYSKRGIGIIVGGPDEPLWGQPYVTACSGDPVGITQFPYAACLNCPDPVEGTTVGRIKGTYFGSGQ